MKCKTQKLIFYAALAVLALFLFTCKPFAFDNYNESDGDEITYTDVVYSQDGKSLTIYLEGTVPITKSQSRAMSLQLAKLGNDFFEVVFAYKNDSGQLAIARAAWETGKAAGITGVYRTAAGVDYSNVRNITTMANGQASAIIFTGKKSDRTLLAVGRLIAVDGVGSISPPVPTPNITTASKTVTFAVDALEGGTGFSTASSTFLTAAKDATAPYTDVSAGNTDLSSILVARNLTPVYIFPAVDDRDTAANYTVNGIGGYLNGIILAGPAVATKTKPRHPMGNGDHDNSTLGIGLESNTVISVTNNQTAGGAFNNVIGFNFRTALADDGMINAFYFEIPVYPLSSLVNPGTWYIRPGYDSYLKDLDNGNRGTGGAVLFGIGDLGYLEYGLNITKPPNKVNYSVGYSYDFDYDGIILWMQSGTYRVMRIRSDEVTYHIIGYLGSPDVQINPGTNLRPYFRDEASGVDPDNPPNTNYAPNKMLTIEVRYTDTDSQVYSDRFAIYDGETNGLVSDPELIPSINRSVIHSWLDLTFFYNGLQDLAPGGSPGSNRTFILVSYFSFDLQQIHLNASNVIFIILAGAPDVVIGRDTPDGGFQHYSGSTGNSYFIGVWPFNQPLQVDGSAITTYPFKINTTGSYAAVGTGPGGTTPATNTNGFVRLQGAVGAATADVQVGGGVEVINPGYLKVQGP